MKKVQTVKQWKKSKVYQFIPIKLADGTVYDVQRISDGVIFEIGTFYPVFNVSTFEDFLMIYRFDKDNIHISCERITNAVSTIVECEINDIIMMPDKKRIYTIKNVVE